MSPADDKNIPKRRTLQTPGVAIVVLVLMIFLYSVDRFLAGLEHREVAAEGRRLYAAGQQLLKENRIPEAIDAFERARALERSNRNYSIALATAQLAGKQIEDARTTLNTILFQDSNYAPANLLMARTMVADQRYHEADSYYHRAIYGTWPNDQSQQRLNARLEVADMLAAHGGSYELLSEALLLQNTSGNTPAILKHVAGLLVQADSPARAAEVYQSVLRLNPRDMESYAGLARAEIQDGNYSAAHLALVKGFLHAPNDVNLRKEMELAGK
ncbi:MAG TPA: tetratricopeptide repeat protein, partial [Bryobacteraceae bacterium]|nr:tetratricopeptide repeat protein [Bryobacteraceae bacterium]